jgi:uncharacterized protein YcfJ
MQKFLVLCLTVVILFDIALAEPRRGNRRVSGRRFGRVSGIVFGKGSGKGSGKKLE